MNIDQAGEPILLALRAERERCAKIAEEYVYPLAGAATGQVIARLIRSGGQQEPK